MDLKLLRAFFQLVDTGHYGKASAKLFVTQSTLSKQIQALEITAGGPLFERGRHGAKLTALGQLLHQEARALLRLSDDIDLKMQRANAGLTGSLDIGFGISTLVTAPQLIAGFRASIPESQITLNDLPSREQHQRLLDGRLDVGFCRAPEGDNDLAFMPVIEERLALVLPHEMTIPSEGRLPDLNRLGFVSLSPLRGPGLDSQISRWCSTIGFTPRIIQYADDILTVHAVVAAGLGAAFLPWHGVNALAGRTHQQPLSGPEATWPVGLCWHRRSSNALLSRFVDYVSKHHG
ncbi:LysR family transcriptional regulator [Rhizobium sp. P44RR-XXIV]|uniref:LysR family transcriptional regulator n=1 Tax=Rhizobium sp. P44RR-XXIV TaxID=1921145 RepID=UPI00098417B1|nr:LysR family transcriptional regulator [Rhizobium sp. P44RR-XXIV]TIX90297.1 LysR family transcriptional regulator [Rhizobium sp. P44RR-XXIV]